MSYKSINVKFTEFSAFGKIIIEIDGITHTINILKSEQYLKAKLKDFIGYIVFTSKKRCKGISK